MPLADELETYVWSFPPHLSPHRSLFAQNGSSPSNSTNGGQNGSQDQLWAVWLTLAIAIYVVGVVFGLVWIFTREYEGRGTPWVPSIFRTEVCCVLVEPLAHVWPALLWPVWLLFLLGYFTLDKAMHATTCCGREMKRSKRRKRWTTEHRRMRIFDDIELVSPRTGSMTPESVRTVSVNTEPIPTPPPMYQSRVNSIADFPSQTKGGPSRVNSDPLPRPQGSRSSRAKSVSELLPAAKGSPRKPSRLSCSARAESIRSEETNGCPWHS